LPYTAIREGYLNADDFFYWLTNGLLPALREDLDSRERVIIMDNLGIYTNLRVIEAIKAVGYLERYLPPYLPNFNPFKLTFSVLKP
jgi:transposase